MKCHQVERVPHLLGGQHEAGDEVAEQSGDGQRRLEDALQVEAEVVEQLESILSRNLQIKTSRHWLCG
jgi:hypothetical protein